MFIAEQQMIAAAAGLAVRGYRPFASSFAAFLTRAYDFIRMASISQLDIGLCGSHAGVSIGEDGPSQMGLEDIAMMRAIYGSTVLYPCDANQTGQLLSAMVDRPGISYLRTTRGKTPVIYESDERFSIGGSRVLRESPDDQVSVIAAGITVHEALQAADEMRANGQLLRVIDAYSVKPLDVQTIVAAAQQTAGRMIIVEDHRAEGGLGSAVLEALSSVEQELPALRIKHLAVRDLPGSGSPAELMEAAGINARHIALAAHALLG
jgi:transketolase